MGNDSVTSLITARSWGGTRLLTSLLGMAEKWQGYLPGHYSIGPKFGNV